MKKRNYWRGRPNKPPENWWQPDRPVIRNVTQSDHEMPGQGGPNQFRPLGSPDSAEAGSNITIRLRREHWITILKFVYLDTYRREKRWQDWRMKVRMRVLDCIKSTPVRQPVTVTLELRDWKLIFTAVRLTAQRRGGQSAYWFKCLEEYLKAQLNQQKDRD